MGQKINPQSFRIGIIKGWPSRWFIKGQYKDYLEQDEAIRNIVKEKISLAGIVSVEIERTSNNLRITIKSSRPGLIIGRGWKGIEYLTKAIEVVLQKKFKGKNKASLSVNVEELKRTEVSSVYLAQQVAWDLEKRMPFRRTMKKYLEQVMQNRDAKGVKILLSGRLGGAEIARREWLKKGM